MTTPANLPIGFSGTSTDYLQAKCDRSGAPFVNRGTISIPSGTVVTTTFGLIPVQAGATLITGGTDVAVAALGTSVTLSIGIVYDDNVGNTNNQTLWTNASAAAAAGGPIPITETVTNIPYVATGNGWIVATVNGATTATTGTLAIQALIAYFNGGIQA